MAEIVARFCNGETRERWKSILREVIALDRSTGSLEAAYIFGSFVTAKAVPADIDLFLVMS
jgi:predicted nucleotidyltransferase